MYFRGAAPAALTFLSVALSLQKVGHPWFRTTVSQLKLQPTGQGNHHARWCIPLMTIVLSNVARHCSLRKDADWMIRAFAPQWLMTKINVNYLCCTTSSVHVWMRLHHTIFKPVARSSCAILAACESWMVTMLAPCYSTAIDTFKMMRLHSHTQKWKQLLHAKHVWWRLTCWSLYTSTTIQVCAPMRQITSRATQKPDLDRVRCLDCQAFKQSSVGQFCALVLRVEERTRLARLTSVPLYTFCCFCKSDGLDIGKEVTSQGCMGKQLKRDDVMAAGWVSCLVENREVSGWAALQLHVQLTMCDPTNDNCQPWRVLQKECGLLWQSTLFGAASSYTNKDIFTSQFSSVTFRIYFVLEAIRPVLLWRNVFQPPLDRRWEKQFIEPIIPFLIMQ